MIRLTWLQFRPQAVTAAVALAAIVVILGLTHADPTLHNPTDNYIHTYGSGLLYVTPALIGIFWGAPLISHELETGTFRLAWTQSVSRTRWLAVKLGLTGLASMATAGLLTLMFTWWDSPIDRVADNPYTMGTFGTHDLVPVGYAAFAFALGVTVGLLVRRAVPAIAITLAVFTAVQFAVPFLVRPHLFTPVRSVQALNPSSIVVVGGNGSHDHNLLVDVSVKIPGAWVYSSQVTTAGGSTDLGRLPAGCASGTWNSCVAAVGKLNLREVVAYQPASRYWVFQWTETGMYLAAALLLTGFCVWRVNRRLTR